MAKKEKSKNLIVPLRLSSLADMARYAYNFDFTYENVFIDAITGGHLLYTFGERLDHKTIIYTFKVKSEATTLLYDPPEGGEPEQALLLPNSSGNAHKVINILRMPIASLNPEKQIKMPNVRTIKLGSIGDLVKLAIRNAGKDGTMMHICCFEDKERLVFYGMDMLDVVNSDDPVLYYAVTAPGEARRHGFAMYDYITGTVALTNAVGEHSYMYLKIINLAERPPFFTGKL